MFKIIGWIIVSLFLAIVGLGVLFFISPSSFYKIRAKLNLDSIEVRADKNLDVNKVDIYWTPEFGPSRKIVERGQELPLIYKEYGPNRFTVTYDQDTVGEFSYWKMNNWHGHYHLIELTQNSKGKIEFSVQVTGPDAGGANGVAITKK